MLPLLSSKQLTHEFVDSQQIVIETLAQFTLAFQGAFQAAFSYLAVYIKMKEAMFGRGQFRCASGYSIIATSEVSSCLASGMEYYDDTQAQQTVHLVSGCLCISSVP